MSAEELCRLEAERLDQMQVAMWGGPMRGSTWHVDRLLGIMDRRAKLCGLDAHGHSGERPLVNIDLLTDDDIRNAAANPR